MTNKLPEKLQVWVDVRKKHHLSHKHIQMAREMGLDPTKFDRLANPKLDDWKEPLPKYIETLYNKRFSKVQPDEVLSIEKFYQAQQEKKQQKKQDKVAAASINKE